MITIIMRNVPIKLDFSGIEKFINILSILKNDKEPTEDEWDELFSTLGYRALIENEFDKSFFKNNFTLAFMPSKAEVLKDRISKEDMVSRFLQHYVYVGENSMKIPRLMEEIKTKLYDNSFKIFNMVGKYLPEGIMHQYDSPTVSFVIFGYDARGYSPITIDLIFAKDIGDYLIYMVAHEMHHFYRNKIAKIGFPSPDDPESAVLWLLNQIEAEGIADLIDKPYLLNLPHNIKSSFLHQWKIYFSENLKRANEILKKVDEYLAMLWENFHDKKMVSNLLKVVPMSGHIIGYHMATTIWDVFGEKITSCVGNPYRFILLYNEAAETLQRYAFSQKSINLIRNVADTD